MVTVFSMIAIFKAIMLRIISFLESLSVIGVRRPRAVPQEHSKFGSVIGSAYADCCLNGNEDLVA